MTQIETFAIDVAERELEELRDRLQRTRWGGDIGGDDWALGVNGHYLRDLCGYWRNGYDWRARERLMNALPHFRTRIDGTPIHFVHVRGQGRRVRPLILTHGWPWTFWDFRKIIGPLVDPAAHGLDAAEAFDVVVPSLPGYGFSSPATTGYAFWQVADLWVTLMQRLGYPRFGAVGGDWGAFISAELGHRFANRLIGVHIQLMLPLDIGSGAGFDEHLFTEAEARRAIDNARFRALESGYSLLQKTKPRTHAIAANDSPAGLLAWLLEKRHRWSDCGDDVERCFTRDDLLDTAMIYWTTQTFGSAARMYHATATTPWRPAHDRRPVVEAPVGCVVFPGEVLVPPRAWADGYYDLKRWTTMPAGGHFGPMEQPDALVNDIRAFFAPLD